MALQPATVSTTLGGVTIAAVTAAKLQQALQSRNVITCTAADTDYAADAVIPDGTKYLIVYADGDAIIAVDTATTASVGVPIAANLIQTIPISFGSGDSKVHAQSPSAGTKVNIGYLKD